MSLWSRFTNLFQTDRLDRELDEELQSHVREAIEEGRNPDEVRRAFDLGVFAVVVGAAITQPESITARFVARIQK